MASDPDKDAANVAKHGVSLTFGARVFDDNEMLVVPTIRVEDGERRFRAIGMVDGRLWTAVHVVRGTVVRFISVRRRNDGARRAYDRP
ncbi:MAG: BrnT family toxin [Sphingomonas fennica]